jgi:predicted signal transduction protein with EAL and GGDEF domain
VKYISLIFLKIVHTVCAYGILNDGQPSIGLMNELQKYIGSDSAPISPTFGFTSLAIFFYWICIVLGVLFVILFANYGAIISSFVAIIFLVSVLFSLLLFHRGLQVLTLKFVTPSMFLTIGTFIVFSGGFHSPILSWILIPPMVGGVLVNERWGIAIGLLAIAYCFYINALSNSIMGLSEVTIMHTQGMRHWLALISIVSALCTMLFFVFINHQILKQVVAVSEEREHTDTLTQILNRSGFNQIISELKSTDSEAAGAIILFDVDNFKAVNDTYGHVFGDHVHVSIASAVKRVIRSDDYFARIGGVSFC